VTDIEKKDLGRNDPCHCGSGKKYKACHLAADETAEREARQKAQAAAPAEEPAAAPAENPAEPRGRKQRNATAQPWKGGQSGPRSVPRFNAPRRSGGS
jgi:hypothetical protein